MLLRTLFESFSYDSDYKGPLHPALEDLYRALRSTPEGRQADWRRDEENEFSNRYYGHWQGDDGSGDYDWQTLSKKTGDSIQKIVREVEKKHRVKIDWQTGEKNWIYFRVEKPVKKARAPKSVDPNPAAGNRAQRVLEIVTTNPTASRQELIQMVVRNTGMTPAGAASYIWKAQKALKSQ